LQGDDTGVVLNRVNLSGTVLFNANTDIAQAVTLCIVQEDSGSNLFPDNLTVFMIFLQSSRLMPK
jgi:hypothetical protein